MEKGIIVFAFGQPSTISANKHLADFSRSLALSLGIKYVFTQRDIGIDSIINFFIVERVEEDEKPPSTLFIAQKSLAWAKSHNLEGVVVFAAPQHRWRCLRDIKKVYFGSNIRIIVPKVPNDHSFWYNRDSTQARTRSWLLWWPREILLRLLPFFIYKRVAR